MTRRTNRTTALLAALLCAVVVGSGTAASAVGPPVPVPADGTALFGVHLDWGTDDPASFAARSGLRPAVVGAFLPLPATAAQLTELSAHVDAVAASRAELFLTVEPAGLAGVTATVAADLAAQVAGYNARGVDVLLRFAHEMNGSWYAWGQQPAAYRAAFTRVADAVHAAAPRTAMVWAPNYGGGYPFAGGVSTAKPGTADFTVLDTDRDGVLTMKDDPYAPYYPGDTAVDWVALTLYHFGHAWPYGENEVPEAGKAAQQLTGTYTSNGSYEDQSALPDFYATWATGHQKPMALAETAALVNETPVVAGASALDIKSAWLSQVYGAPARAAFPLLKLVNWFEVRKYESEAKGVVDWRATWAPSVLAVLRPLVGTGAYGFAGTPATAPVPAPVPAPVAPTAPQALTATAGPGRLAVTWRAPVSTGESPVTGYRVCAGTTSCVTTTGTSATLDALARRTAYPVSVTAANAAGSSLPASGSFTTK